MSTENTGKSGSVASHYYLAVMSTDTKFMCRLIDWLNNQSCENGSTVIRQHDSDPYEELDLRLAQIDGMTTRVFDLEKRLADAEAIVAVAKSR
jgi:hypothetical protein